MKVIIVLFALQLTIVAAFSQQDTLPARVYNLHTIPASKDSSRNRIQIMDGRSFDLSNLEVHLTTLEPGKAAHPPHVHDSTEELIIVKEGLVKMTIAGKEKLLHAGGVALSLPGDKHGATNVGKTKASYYVLKYTTGNKPNLQQGEKAGGSVLIDWDEIKADKTAKGERRNFFNRSTGLFSKFEMHVTTLNKGEVSHPPHTHTAEEIILIRSGNVSMYIDGKDYPAMAGDVVFLSTNVPHALENKGDGPTEYFAFQWQW